jgi:hypothetical protein
MTFRPTLLPATKILACLSMLVMVGCAGTAPQQSVPLINNYNASTADYEGLGSKDECDAKHNLFNRRQLMVTSMAVQSAWFYCLKYSGGAYFPEEEKEDTSGDWTNE